jgi:signal transduction histidine kinase
MSGRTSRAAIGVVAGVVLIGVLVAIAVVLANQQKGDRDDLEDGFRDRATVSAALTQSLFEASATAGAAENSRKFGSAQVSQQTMAATAKQGGSAYVVLLGPKSEVIASSPGTPASVFQRLRGSPADVRAVMEGSSFGLSNFIDFGKGLRVFEYAGPVQTEFGRRVLVNGVSPQLLAAFLSGYLNKVPNAEGGAAYLLDANNATIAATVPGAPPGSPPQDTELLNALSEGSQGSFSGEYFVTAPLEGSPWRVVATAPESTLFASVSGAHKWVPWLIFTLFALAGAAVLLLVTRVLRGADQLSDANQRLEEANFALEQRAEELGRSNAELEQFASIASHDLKEPLRKVQTFTGQLAQKDAERLSDEGRDYLERTATAASRMQGLIDDLLRFSRVATQGRPFEPVDLAEVTHQAVSDLEAVIEESGGRVEIGDLPVVLADPVQMRHLVQNLISNGLKFHRDGVPPEIRISGRKRGRFAEIEISDNGIGFEPQYNARIFRVFERLHGRGTYPGTGIGLALCRKIVDRHGGTISAESTPGEGSAFTVTLPLHSVDAPDGAPASQDGDRSERARVHA